MEFPCELKSSGFSLCDAELSDFSAYYAISKTCYEKYVDEYFGGWIEEAQTEMNTNAFNNEMRETCFKKILLNDFIAGFLAYNIQEDKIDGVMIQMLENARNKGVGSFFLNHIIKLSDQQNKPIFLQVFMSNPAQDLYKKFGFTVYDKTNSHYLMKYTPKPYG